MDSIKHGLVVACVGDPGQVTYKRSWRGNAEIDRASRIYCSTTGQPYEILDFSPYGYDERQYCSPGFNLPWEFDLHAPWTFPQHHMSADNLDFVQPEYLADSLAIIWPLAIRN